MSESKYHQLTGDDDEDTKAQVCLFSQDGRGHCMHWWDGDPCCWCGSNEGHVDGEDDEE